METAPFAAAAEDLIRSAGLTPTAIMCAEAVWWRCHRGLIADYLKVRGHRVFHIFDAGKLEEHPYTSAARVVDGHLNYTGQVPSTNDGSPPGQTTLAF